jgi:hypothetical protein|tara:strand:+ start:122 stop:499 length:378 start_codon:yes stop_codon:yes gene_type:complete
MKFFIITFLFSISYSFCQENEGVLKIEQDSLVSKIVGLKIKINEEFYASQFYSIQLYYGNYETAKEIESNTKKKFPDETIKLSFETPNYKVQMGPYRGFQKSNDLLKNVKKIYPAAFIIEPKKNL